MDTMNAGADYGQRIGQCLRWVWNTAPGTRRSWPAGVMLWLAVAGAGAAQDIDPEASPVWQKVRADLFGDSRIEPADKVLLLQSPKRAEDAAVVPIAIRALLPQTSDRYVETLWLIVDNNPSPISAVFHLTPDGGRADIETRIRVEQYTHVRAIARLSDRKLYMAANYVKASGGCSAPANRDAAASSASLGKMRLRVDDAVSPQRPALVQLMISHPNESGLAMDQVTRTYPAAHFVRTVEVNYRGKLLLSGEVDFTISENPNFRFFVLPGDGGELEAKATDNQGLEFTAKLTLDPAQVGASVSR